MVSMRGKNTLRDKVIYYLVLKKQKREKGNQKHK